MKKRIIFNIIAILACCFVLSACGSDPICGDWEIDSYSYLYNGTNYEYTTEEAKDFEPSIEIMENKDGKYTDKQVVEATIGILYTNSYNLTYRFKNKNVLEIVGVGGIVEYNWTRKGESIVATSSEVDNPLTFVFKDDNTIYLIQKTDGNVANNQMEITLKRN